MESNSRKVSPNIGIDLSSVANVLSPSKTGRADEHVQ